MKEKLIQLLKQIMNGRKGYCENHYIYTPQLNADNINKLHTELVASQTFNSASEQNQINDSVIPNKFKQVTCQATLCKHYKWRATCTAEYLELDEHGTCIYFTRKQKISNDGEGRCEKKREFPTPSLGSRHNGMDCGGSREDNDEWKRHL